MAIGSKGRPIKTPNRAVMTTDSNGSQHTLYYAHDPMCSWCWGFRPTWEQLQQALPDTIATQYVLGGLAPDTTQPMPESMQQMLQQTWHQIAQSIPGTQFNHAFWTQNKPRRATYPACRAVLAAISQDIAFEEPMISAIQQAYYLNARNPSDDEVLIELASQIGCDVTLFKESLNAESTNEELMQQIHFARKLGAQGFPSLFFEAIGKTPIPLTLSYSNNACVFEQIDLALGT